MNKLTAWFNVCVVFLLSANGALAESVMRAEDYIRFTAYSERIVLITVKEVALKTLKVDMGIELREVSIKGTRIESIRGNDKGHDFLHTSNERRIIDMVEAESSYSSDAIDIFRKSPPHRPSSCKVGHRYLVIFFEDRAFFYEVPGKSEKWRSQILKYRDREK
jgi:hypothetical protein